MKIQRIAAAALLAACLVFTGCRGAGGGASGDDAQGGSVSAANKLPSDAVRVAEATNNRIIHRLLREGTVYVVDGETNRVLYKGPNRANTNVVIDPAANAITLNDQQVKPTARLQTQHTYRLYFKQK